MHWLQGAYQESQPGNAAASSAKDLAAIGQEEQAAKMQRRKLRAEITGLTGWQQAANLIKPLSLVALLLLDKTGGHVEMLSRFQKPWRPGSKP